MRRDDEFGTAKARILAQQRLKLFDAINSFCRQHGAAVVSIPGLKEIRIETPKNSGLAVKLAELGYNPHHAGMTTRIEAGTFTSVDVLEIFLPR